MAKYLNILFLTIVLLPLASAYWGWCLTFWNCYSDNQNPAPVQKEYCRVDDKRNSATTEGKDQTIYAIEKTRLVLECQATASTVWWMGNCTENSTLVAAENNILFEPENYECHDNNLIIKRVINRRNTNYFCVIDDKKYIKYTVVVNAVGNKEIKEISFSVQNRNETMYVKENDRVKLKCQFEGASKRDDVATFWNMDIIPKNTRIAIHKKVFFEPWYEPDNHEYNGNDLVIRKVNNQTARDYYCGQVFDGIYFYVKYEVVLVLDHPK